MKNYKDISTEVFVQTLVEKLKQAKEYIKLDEALDVTGLSEKTLRDHMRSSVTPIGRNAWDREEFFEYWKQSFDEKKSLNKKKTQAMTEIVERILEKRPKRSKN